MSSLKTARDMNDDNSERAAQLFVVGRNYETLTIQVVMPDLSETYALN